MEFFVVFLKSVRIFSFFPFSLFFFLLFFFFFVSFLLFSFLFLILLIIKDGPFLHHTGNYICNFEDVPLYIFFVILAGYVIALIVIFLFQKHFSTSISNFFSLLFISSFFKFFLIRLRNLKQKYLKEYKQTRFIFVLFTICYIVYLVIIGAQQQFYIWGRCVCAMLVILLLKLKKQKQKKIKSIFFLSSNRSWFNQQLHFM